MKLPPISLPRPVARPPSNLLRYGGFLILLGLALGVLWSFYQPVRYEDADPELFMVTKADHRFSTREIMRAMTLNRQLRLREAKNDALESEISVLNYEISRQLRHRYHASYLTHYRRITDLNGVRAKEENGIEVVLKDASARLQPGEDPNIGIVHNVDLLVLVNQLWASGAKAISVNGQRIVASSEISCTGPVIVINKSRVSSPFVIRAIGDTDKMLDRLERANSYLKYLAAYGISTLVETKKVSIPAFSSSQTVSSL